MMTDISRLLVAHSVYLTGRTSGENQVVRDEVELLESSGIEVYRCTPKSASAAPSLSAGINVIWNRSARHAIEELIRANDLQIAHFHNLYPNLSPAALRATVRTGIASVMTVHNFRMQCMAGTFLRSGRICQECLGHVPWRGVAHGCYRNSRLQSAAMAGSMVTHRIAESFDRVTIFVALSEFMRAQLIAGGVDGARIRVRKNFAWPTTRRTSPGDYFLFVGRISHEKGLDIALDACRGGTELVVAGDGHLRPELEEASSGSVHFLGSVESTRVRELLERARGLLVPSRSYEGSPRVIVEAMAAGVPVVASDVGGLPEHIEDGISGLLVPLDDVDAWVEAIDRLRDDDLSMALGEAAHQRWQEEFSPGVALESLLAIYREAIEIHAAQHA